jgi:signal transduction histidine kinase
MTNQSDSTPLPGSTTTTEGADSDSQMRRRLAFLQLTDDDARILRQLAKGFPSWADDFVESFYRHLQSFPETSRLLQDAAHVEKLKRLQMQHLQSMLESAWDEEYIERRRAVGQAHADVGLEPQLFLGAYNQYLQFALPVLAGGRPDGTARLDQVLPLLKVVLLDIGLTLEAYFRQSTVNLQQALDLLFKTNSELRRFAQLTSHDLKTPLATVANLCDEVLDEFGGQIPAEAARLVDAARQRAFRMSSTIDELLAAALATMSPDGEETASTEDVLADVIETLRPQFAQKQIKLTVAHPLPRVKGNKARLREAFYNLLSNAAKFMNKDHGKIEIIARLDGGHCQFTIADNGPGIPRDELERIFVPFRRLPAHRDRPGSGLGLYFTKTIIEELGGHVWAEAELGVGSKFHVCLECAPDDARTDMSAESASWEEPSSRAGEADRE